MREIEDLKLEEDKPPYNIKLSPRVMRMIEQSGSTKAKKRQTSIL
jgi:ribosomal protein L28